MKVGARIPCTYADEVEDGSVHEGGPRRDEDFASYVGVDLLLSVRVHSRPRAVGL